MLVRGMERKGNQREHLRVLTSQVHPQHQQLPVRHQVRVMEHLGKAWFTETADTSPQDDDEQELEAIEEEADEPNDNEEHGDDADNDDDDDPSSSLADLAEVLTVTAKKISGLTLGSGME